MSKGSWCSNFSEKQPPTQYPVQSQKAELLRSSTLGGEVEVCSGCRGGHGYGYGATEWQRYAVGRWGRAGSGKGSMKGRAGRRTTTQRQQYIGTLKTHPPRPSSPTAPPPHPQPDTTWSSLLLRRAPHPLSQSHFLAITSALFPLLLQARNAFCAVRPPGHHAGPTGVVTNPNDAAGSHGFCLLSNVAIGAAYAMNVHRHAGGLGEGRGIPPLLGSGEDWGWERERLGEGGSWPWERAAA